VQAPASSRLQVPEPVLYNRPQVLESADDSLDSNDGEYEGNDGQSEESEENELGQHGDDMDHPSAWGAQRPIGREFLSSQGSILTITPGNTQNSSRRISYPGRRTSAQVRVSQNCCTSAIPSRSPTDFNPLAMPVITPSHPDPTVRELDSGGQQGSSRRNMATGLERTIVGRSRDLMWDWTICVNPSAKKPFSPDVSSPRPDETSPLFASRPSGSPEPSLPFISCVWCARTPHFPSQASDALLATPPPPSAFLLYPPPYLLVYRPHAYSYQLGASGGPPRSPLTSSDLDLSAPVR